MKRFLLTTGTVLTLWALSLAVANAQPIPPTVLDYEECVVLFMNQEYRRASSDAFRVSYQPEGTQNPGQHARTYVSFTVPPTPANTTVRLAKFGFRPSLGSSQPWAYLIPSVAQVLGEEWGLGQLRSELAPDPMTAPAPEIDILQTGPVWYVWDVTSFVSSLADYSTSHQLVLVLYAESDQGLPWDGVNGPECVVSVSNIGSAPWLSIEYDRDQVKGADAESWSSIKALYVAGD